MPFDYFLGGYFLKSFSIALWIFLEFFSGLSLRVSVAVPRQTSFLVEASQKSTMSVPFSFVIARVVDEPMPPIPPRQPTPMPYPKLSVTNVWFCFVEAWYTTNMLGLESTFWMPCAESSDSIAEMMR